MNENKGVSVVICCYNSSTRIKTTLEHLQAVMAKDISWEVVLVDNNSNDDTVEKAQKIWSLNPVTRLNIVKEKTPGLMHARITGVKNSQFHIVSFIDDDNWVDPNWVENANRIMESDKSIAACGGDSEAVFEAIPPSWFSSFEKSYAVGKQHANNGYVSEKIGYLWGAGLTIRKKAWEDLFKSGYVSLLPGRKGKSLSAGEDSEICLALVQRGWKLWYDNSLKLKHFIPSARLNINYLKGMYKGFGKAEVILAIYRSLINSKGTNTASWIFQCITSVKLLWHSGLKTIFSSRKDRIRNKIFWIHDRAYTWELINSRTKYSRVRKLVSSAGYLPKNGEMRV